MAKKSALGRGLGDILSDIGSTYESQFNEVLEDDNSGIVDELDINLIDPNPYQPRKEFNQERLQELSESIKKHGLLQPIVVIEHDDRYILIAGERRLRASKLAGFETIKAIIADVDILDEIRLRELALIENIQRENLNPIELAQSYKELIEVHKITHEELSNIVHKSRAQITNTLRLLNLDKYVQDALISNKITQGHAKILVGLDAKEQKVLVDTIIGQKLSVRDLEQIVLNKKRKSDTKSNKINTSTFKLSKEQKALLKEVLPFDIKIKQNSVEILLHSEQKLQEFISFIKKD